LWNGGLAVNSFIGQPQKEFFATKMAFSACYVLMVAILGAFDKHVRILVADFLKEIPMTLFRPNGI
jgi:putative copper export protein